MKLGRRVIAYVAVVMALLSVVVLSTAGVLLFRAADTLSRAEAVFSPASGVDAVPQAQTGVLARITGLTGPFSPTGVTDHLSANSVWDRTLRTLASLVIAVILAIGFAIAVLNRGINRMVLDRVTQLEGGVRRIRKSGRPEPLEFHGNDEIASLAVNIEAMVNELEESKRQVEENRDELENRVRDRTAELEATVVDLQSQAERRATAERAVELTETRYRSLINNLNDLVFTMHRDGNFTFASSAVERFFGITPEQAVGRHASALFGVEAQRLVVRLERDLPREGIVINIDGCPGNGRSLDLEITLLPAAEDSSIVHGIARDVTARRRQENELLHIASHDFLTGLANRRRFEERLRMTLVQASAEGNEGAVLWLDLDGFKEINDALGHKVGDDLLVSVSRMLSACVRSDSLIARIGGDEFAILLPDADERAASSTAERLLRGFAGMRAEAHGRSLRVSASIGVVLYPEHSMDAEELVSLADSTMYRAKNLGRSRYKVFEVADGYASGADDVRAWTGIVEHALAADAFDVFAQPICDAGTGVVSAYELLIRLEQRDADELILPERFLPIAERSGAIVDIDLWMLTQAARILEEHAHQSFGLNVNLSVKTISDARLLTTLKKLSSSLDIDLTRLTLELTEDAVIADPAGMADALGALHAMGCKIALDDFGSGFTSFFHLKRLPIDAVKIDGSFVGSMSTSANDRHLVRAMVELARGLNMKTTAEFVESQNALHLLRVFGVDSVEGHLIGSAAPVAEVLARHNDRHVHPQMAALGC
ncbi:MAG TPA: EAL domain-containing protein [Coriobacteriia bacterium]|nr:EAL domain-containing protein [Coriobacteriia bacterium]